MPSVKGGIWENSVCRESTEEESWLGKGGEAWEGNGSCMLRTLIAFNMGQEKKQVESPCLTQMVTARGSMHQSGNITIPKHFRPESSLSYPSLQIMTFRKLPWRRKNTFYAKKGRFCWLRKKPTTFAIQQWEWCYGDQYKIKINNNNIYDQQQQ